MKKTKNVVFVILAGLILIGSVIITGCCNKAQAQDTVKFNNEVVLQEVTTLNSGTQSIPLSSKYPNMKLYKDAQGNQYIEMKFQILGDTGLLLPEKGTSLENWLIFPTQATSLELIDVKDIFKFIDYRDLKNRMK